MGKALYRSYRSKSFDEVIGQDHVTKTLSNSLKKGTYAHAYLLTGPRGVGKTSVARILAHAVNKVDYPSNPPQVDIIEIDAASNRRIDEIRELREKVVIAPTSLKYKVYIIDEVHMLTREAFNALLKTLEEPPEHAIFILATTDFHKVPDTITSRCIRFHFKPISSEDIASHLSSIAKKEGLKISAGALELIAAHSSGSFRDAIALLDQLRGTGSSVSEVDIQRLLGLGSEATVETILKNVAAGDIKSVLATLEEAKENGIAETSLARQLIQALQKQLLSPSYLSRTETVNLIEELLKVESYTDNRLALELALLKSAVSRDKGEDAPPIQETAPKLNKNVRMEKSNAPKESNQKDLSLEKTEPKPTAASLGDWQALLEELKKENRSLYAVARMAKASFNDKVLSLSFEFAFHYKQMNQQKNTRLIRDMADKIFAGIEDINIELAPQAANDSKTDQTIKNINNIFGASEVLES